MTPLRSIHMLPALDQPVPECHAGLIQQCLIRENNDQSVAESIQHFRRRLRRRIREHFELNAEILSRSKVFARVLAALKSAYDGIFIPGDVSVVGMPEQENL